jgi:hypothetical protein
MSVVLFIFGGSFMRALNKIPIQEWSSGWLKLECSSLLKDAYFLILHDEEKRARGYPVTDDEMRKYIREHQKGD